MNKRRPMETIGESIEEMQDLMKKIIQPVPDWIPKWQVEAEHVLHLAHVAKDQAGLDKLRMLDGEAKRLVEQRRTWMTVN